MAVRVGTVVCLLGPVLAGTLCKVCHARAGAWMWHCGCGLCWRVVGWGGGWLRRGWRPCCARVHNESTVQQTCALCVRLMITIFLVVPHDHHMWALHAGSQHLREPKYL